MRWFGSKNRTVLSVKSLVTRQRALNLAYILLFSYLILYSIFTTLYLDHGSWAKHKQPYEYDIKGAKIKPIKCSFTLSSQYQKTPRYICYILLTFTIVVRNYQWLAVGAAVSVMTYSGVAAINLVIFFAAERIFDIPDEITHCQKLPISGSREEFFACAGVRDPDIAMAVTVVSTVMLGALPMAALSATFKQSTNKAILVFWLLLLAVGHTFDNLISANQNLHFQIGPQDDVENVPGTNYQAPLLDQSWSDAFNSLVSESQQVEGSLGNHTSFHACLYSCFATDAYPGRRTQDISIFTETAYVGPFIKNMAQNRYGGIVFWGGCTLS